MHRLGEEGAVLVHQSFVPPLTLLSHKTTRFQGPLGVPFLLQLKPVSFIVTASLKASASCLARFLCLLSDGRGCSGPRMPGFANRLSQWLTERLPSSGPALAHYPQAGLSHDTLAGLVVTSLCRSTVTSWLSCTQSQVLPCLVDKHGRVPNPTLLWLTQEASRLSTEPKLF